MTANANPSPRWDDPLERPSGPTSFPGIAADGGEGILGVDVPLRNRDFVAHWEFETWTEPPRPISLSITRVENHGGSMLDVETIRSARMEDARWAIHNHADRKQLEDVLDVPLDLRSLRRRPGRRGRSDYEYAAVAKLYVHKIATSLRPRKDLAEELHVSDSTLGNLLAEARRRGLLEQPGSGTVMCSMTEKGEAVLGDGPEGTTSAATTPTGNTNDGSL